MNIQTRSAWALPLLLAVGCATSSQQFAATSADTPSDSVGSLSASETAITPVDYQESVPAELIQPQTVAEGEQTTTPVRNDSELLVPQRLPSTDGLTLGAIEQMALANNPAIAQSEARVRALRGKWVQVGLPPNPTAGYTAGEIGNDGAAGQQGVFVGQTYITGKKLQRNRAVVSAEISQAEQELAAMRRRVQTDVQRGYYEALLAQRRVELTSELVRITGEAVQSSESLVEAEEIPVAGLLQTEVQYQNALVLLQTAKNGLSRAWRSLSALIGGPELPMQSLAGDISDLPVSLEWQEQLARLQTESPEVATAIANVERARRALNRACVEAVPDISTQVSVQYDDSTGDTITGVQVGMPIPLWNKNQGGIRQAQAEVTQAVRNVDRVELDLNNRLALVFQQYADAQVTAEAYRSNILPRSQRTFNLVQKGYQQGEVGYLDLLAAQQTFSQTNLTYLDAVGNLWESYVRIQGLLLDESLGTAVE